MNLQLKDIVCFDQVGDIPALLESKVDASLRTAQAEAYVLPPVSFYNRFDLAPDYDVSWAPRNGNPDVWEKMYPNPMADRYLHMMHNAMVFGGLVRERSVRAYGNSHAQGQLLVSQRGELLPASYGIMDGAYSLPHDLIVEEDGRRFAHCDAPVSELPGIYLFLGQAHIHFGHFLVEGLARLWALFRLPEPLRSQIKILVYEPEIKPFAHALLNRMGIGSDRIVHCAAATRVERLIVPDAIMRTHHWIRDEIATVWNSIAGPQQPAGPKKVFLSRPVGSQRGVTNLTEVEALVASWGYIVVYPERFSIDEQIAFVRNADSIVSFSGSQSYLCAFQKAGGRNLILAPRNFFLTDDLLIAGVKGHETHVCFGSVVNTRGKEGWTCPVEDLSGM